jgi:hypothetical protein
MAGLDFCDTVLACSFEDAQAVESDAQLMEESFKAGQSLASRDI